MVEILTQVNMAEMLTSLYGTYLDPCW
jgi:hypothetical protein